ncbi:MAG: DUF4189 domain-containing protein [Microcystis panniformis Mp_MB_F_20051200_S9]|uniref:DUF4189 domain-containing protein n=1 Tax=Microcystis panniformis Mp_MB_F_20051200_S9 TaxID=2486223 RepID=A0A552Q817_9CHRO|nr:MAG: DUF4189 domain-containing protein [Microcystis panniformis Mp_MB_F_20080800_S26D]TRV50891.1 MAG: DUF4189 domain-containing protein [Microcystis panniformis Mp_GB_SS_20050300_S99D]TRV54564.1 MAG: DUF4189 domain-containing protein [Microcystis panniformis Mp_GB_SS_20050300_S99]TRV58309.1 MAG: DUF4189 domain-containing protein [Microcystis panniformis Mp_MB_F_20080800_S26]TRV65356.1 MAG: DUF4189 domain-containing protein [Microcystis panniformis Mp_MB_F_20051200_S9]TRV67015.1 MAG: DUF4189
MSKISTIIIAACTALPFGLGVPTALAQNYFGAIAYSEETGYHGYSYDYPTRAIAESRALAECESYSRSGDCQVLIWFRNGCGALATASDGSYGSGWGDNRPIAEQYALQSCGSSECRVIRWVCTTR